MHNGIPTPKKYDEQIKRYIESAMNSYYIDNKILRKIVVLGARKSIIDCVDFLVDKLCSAYDLKCDKVCCFLAPLSWRRDFNAFCVDGNNARELAELIGNDAFDELYAEVEKHFEEIEHFHRACYELDPSQIYLWIDFVEKRIRCRITRYVSDKRMHGGNTHKFFNAWLKENGGKPKPIFRTTEKFWPFWRYVFFGTEIKEKDYKLVEDKEYITNPTEGSEEVDLEAIRAEIKLAMEGEFIKDENFVNSEEDEPEVDMDDAEVSNNCKGTAKMFREHRYELEDVIAYDYLEGDTGFLAIKAALDELYHDDDSASFLYFDTVADLRHEYNLPQKKYPYTLYEYIAVYDAGDSWHIISLGMSELGAERDDLYKRYDAEYTMRIPQLDDEDMDEAEWANAINLVSILADEACNKERMLEDYSYIGLGFRKGIDYKRESDKVAFIIVPDARIGSVEGPFGTVHLRQAVPITKAEYDALKSKEIDVKTLYGMIGTDLVDYARPSVI